jgi:hypothetical protein
MRKTFANGFPRPCHAVGHDGPAERLQHHCRGEDVSATGRAITSGAQQSNPR